MRPKKTSNARSGRPRQRDSGPVWGTHAEAASALGLTVPALMAARASGCPGFRSGRVHETEVSAWLKANPNYALPELNPEDKSIEEAKKRKVWAEVAKLEQRNARDHGTTISRAWVAERCSACCSDWNAKRCRFEAEWAGKFDGKSIEECRAIIRLMMTDVGQVLLSLWDNFKDEPK